MIFAHRGDSWFYPENTILSFNRNEYESTKNVYKYNKTMA